MKFTYLTEQDLLRIGWLGRSLISVGSLRRTPEKDEENEGKSGEESESGPGDGSPKKNDD